MLHIPSSHPHHAATGNHHHMKKSWIRHTPPALESFPSFDSATSGPPTLVSPPMSFGHLLPGSAIHPHVEPPYDQSAAPSFSAIPGAPSLPHRPIRVHLFTEDLRREYGSHVRQVLSPNRSCATQMPATLVNHDGGCENASDAFASFAQTRSPRPLIDINQPPPSPFVVLSQDSTQAPATPAVSEGSKPVACHGVNMLFPRDAFVADALHGVATATAARTHPPRVPTFASRERLAAGDRPMERSLTDAVVNRWNSVNLERIATEYDSSAVSGPQSPAPRSALPHSLRHKAISRMSGLDMELNAVVPGSNEMQNQLQQQQQHCQQKYEQAMTSVSPRHMDASSGHDSSARFYSERHDTVSSQENDGVVKTCVHCGTSKTPLWRNGPPGPKSLCNACGIRFNKIRSGKRKASPQEAAMLREYETINPSYSKALPALPFSPIHKARSKFPPPPGRPFEDLPAAATSSCSDCDSEEASPRAPIAILQKRMFPDTTAAGEGFVGQRSLSISSTRMATAAAAADPAPGVCSLEEYRPFKKHCSSSADLKPPEAGEARSRDADSTGASCLSLQATSAPTSLPAYLDLNETSQGTGEGADEAEDCTDLRTEKFEVKAGVPCEEQDGDRKVAQDGKAAQDDVVLGAELLVSLLSCSPV